MPPSSMPVEKEFTSAFHGSMKKSVMAVPSSFTMRQSARRSSPTVTKVRLPLIITLSLVFHSSLNWRMNEMTRARTTISAVKGFSIKHDLQRLEELDDTGDDVESSEDLEHGHQ